jgi:DNA-binding NtrC family response regulator
MILLFCGSAHYGAVRCALPAIRLAQNEVSRMSRSQIVSIVDDDASVRAAIESLVRSLGFVAFGFESAEDFLGSPRVHDSACLISDVQMPGLSGLDLQDRLIAQGSRIPVIFVTAFPEQTIRRCAHADNDVIAVLGKPFGGETMSELLRQAVAATSSSRTPTRTLKDNALPECAFHAEWVPDLRSAFASARIVLALTSEKSLISWRF